MNGGDQIFDFHVIEAGNNRRAQNRDRNVRIGQFADGIKATVRCGRAGLKQVRQPVIKACDRYGNRCPVLGGHGGDEVNVAGDKRAFGDDRKRMLAIAEHTYDRSGQLLVPVDGLIWIGAGANHKRGRGIAACRKLFAQKSGRLRFPEQLGFKIKPRR